MLSHCFESMTYTLSGASTIGASVRIGTSFCGAPGHCRYRIILNRRQHDLRKQRHDVYVRMLPGEQRAIRLCAAKHANGGLKSASTHVTSTSPWCHAIGYKTTTPNGLNTIPSTDVQRNQRRLHDARVQRACAPLDGVATGATQGLRHDAPSNTFMSHRFRSGCWEARTTVVL
jgi:hypothetical protein